MYRPYLIDGKSNTQILETHLLLLAAMFLHESNEAGTLSISICILVQLDDELRVTSEGRIVATATS